MFGQEFMEESCADAEGRRGAGRRPKAKSQITLAEEFMMYEDAPLFPVASISFAATTTTPSYYAYVRMYFYTFRRTWLYMCVLSLMKQFIFKDRLENMEQLW